MRTTPEQKVGRTGVVSDCFSRIMGFTRVLGGILFFALLHNPVQAVSSVTFAWDRNPEASVVDYRIRYGVVSRTYTDMVSTGNATSATISNLVEGATYYFAVTAYNIFGLESDYSNEIPYPVPMALARVQIRAASARQIILTVTGPSGRTYDIQATPDFKTWKAIGTVTLGAGGSLDLIDTNAAIFSKRFYRTRDIQP
jgi:hypothetical protein